MSQSQATANPHYGWLKEAGAVPDDSVFDDPHPWLHNLRAMAELIRGTLVPPHDDSYSFYFGPGPGQGWQKYCPICDAARHTQALARKVCDVRVELDPSNSPFVVSGRASHQYRNETRGTFEELVICPHGHLFTLCEWCVARKKAQDEYIGINVVLHMDMMEVIARADAHILRSAHFEKGRTSDGWFGGGTE